MDWIGLVFWVCFLSSLFFSSLVVLLYVTCKQKYDGMAVTNTQLVVALKTTKQIKGDKSAQALSVERGMLSPFFTNSSSCLLISFFPRPSILTEFSTPKSVPYIDVCVRV